MKMSYNLHHRILSVQSQRLSSQLSSSIKQNQPFISQVLVTQVLYETYKIANETPNGQGHVIWKDAIPNLARRYFIHSL